MGTRYGRTVGWRWLAAAMTVLAAVSLGCAWDDEVPTLERLAQEVNRVVMCPVCPGESIDQSQHPLAVQMRGIVVEKIEQGWTKGQIFDFFAERYGPSVLLDPPRDGINLVVWVVPPLGLAVAAAVLYTVLRLMVRGRVVGSDGPVAAVDLSEEERVRYVRRVEAVLGSEAAGDSQHPEDLASRSGDEATL